MGRFDGKTVVVTGGESGIGRACVERFCAEGARVASLDVREGDRARPDAARFYACDVSKSADVDAAFARIAVDLGDVDHLVNNAGIQHYGTVTDTPEEEWDRVLAVNLKGAYLCARRAIPMIQRRGGGAVINVSSVQAFVSQRSVAPYTTSKTALLGLTRSIAVDYAPRVRCVAVCPGTVLTEMFAWAIDHAPERAAVRGEAGDVHLAHRIGRPEEIAGLIAYLCSEEASFITGQSVRIDGGMGVTIGDAGGPDAGGRQA